MDTPEKLSHMKYQIVRILGLLGNSYWPWGVYPVFALIGQYLSSIERSRLSRSVHGREGNLEAGQSLSQSD